jgi:hypothetical protein
MGSLKHVGPGLKDVQKNAWLFYMGSLPLMLESRAAHVGQDSPSQINQQRQIRGLGLP